jgi:Rhs element Vgr protein
MASSPLVESTTVFSFSILSGGSEIPDSYEVMGLTITEKINTIAQAQITLKDGSSIDETFQVTDGTVFKPGAEIEIKLGYDSKNESIFKGIVVKQTIRVDEGNVARLQITCKDKAYALTRNREHTIFTEITDSDLITQLIQKASGVSADVSSTSVTHSEIPQSDASDWDLINVRAGNNKMIVVNRLNKVTVAEPDVSNTPELKIQFGYDMIEFDTEIDASNQISSVECSGWDMATQKMITATSSEPSVNKQGDISGKELDVFSLGTKKLTTSGAMDQDALQSWADSELLRLRLSRFTGSVTFLGSAKAQLNTNIELAGLSDRFNGNAFISGITHSVYAGTWHTTAQIGLPAETFAEAMEVSSPSASGLIPGINGLQTGIVKKIDSDPDNQFRIQVEMPILGEHSDPVWARLSTFYVGGDETGAFFMPELEDEVILGFMNNDPRFPVILGSVYSSKMKMPETPDEENSIKTLVTKNKLQIKFDDKEKIITVLTPAGNTLTLSDKDGEQGITITDQYSNQIQTNTDGITLQDKSSNKVEMNSDGITLNSPSSITIKASQDVSISGMSVTVSGQQSATLKGSASCEVSSGGETNVKGTMVNIN